MDELSLMKIQDPEEFHHLVKMHLSFLLDLSMDGSVLSFDVDQPDGSKPSKCLPSGGFKGIMDGAVLTMEGVCQIYQIIQFLEQPHHITTEGIFRKHGNLKKQQLLKERLNQGIQMNLDDGEFSVHECASVLKGFLADLPEPLLTNAYFEAHCQVARLETATDKQRQALQLLLMLVPDPNFKLLKDLLLFLHQVSLNEAKNKMSALNLGTMFASHILCPRKIPSEVLQANHQLYSNAIAFMITHAPELLDKPPPQLLKDISAHNLRKCVTPKRLESPSKFEESSPIVNTIFSFVDHSKSREIASSTNTETALAELYAQVQAMPNSTKKKRLIKQFNDANGCGTPNATPSKGGARRMLGDSFKNWIVPKAKVVKEKKSGSYDLNVKPEDVAHNTFRKQCSVDLTTTPQKSCKLIETPATPTENQNNLYFKTNSYSAAMMDECDSIVETKQLVPGYKAPTPELQSNEKENFV